MVPALIITIGSLVLPDTPNSMIERGQHDEAKAKLQRIRGVDDVSEEFSDLVAASEASKQIEDPWRNLLKRKYRPHLSMAILIPFFQQLTGINVIMFYAPVLFNTIGFGSDASLMSAVITGSVNVLATMVSIYGVDKWGRRFLFLEGGAQMLICQVPFIKKHKKFKSFCNLTIGFFGFWILINWVFVHLQIAGSCDSLYWCKIWGGWDPWRIAKVVCNCGGDFHLHICCRLRMVMGSTGLARPQ